MIINISAVLILLTLVLISELKTHLVKNTIVIPFALGGLFLNLFQYGSGSVGFFLSFLGFAIPILVVVLLNKIAKSDQYIGGGIMKLFSAIGSIMGLTYLFRSVVYSVILAFIINVFMNESSIRGKLKKSYLQIFLYPNKFGEKVYSSEFRLSLTSIFGVLIAIFDEKIPIYILAALLVITILAWHLYFKMRADYPNVHCSRGIKLYSIGNFDEAINHFNLAIEKDPYFADAYCGLGNCYFSLRDYDISIKNYEKVLQINPDLNDSNFSIGVCYFYIQMYDTALEYIDLYINYDSTYAPAYFEKSRILVMLGRHNESLNCLQTALELDDELVVTAMEDSVLKNIENHQLFEELIKNYCNKIVSN